MDTKKYMSRPIREVIRNVALAIADGQADLDRNAVAIQKKLERSLTEAEGAEAAEALEPPHYQFSEVDVDLKTKMTIAAEPDLNEDGEERAVNPILSMGFQDQSSSSSSKEADVESNMTSKISFKIVPTAPPKSGGRPSTSGQRTESNQSNGDGSRSSSGGQGR